MDRRPTFRLRSEDIATGLKHTVKNMSLTDPPGKQFVTGHIPKRAAAKIPHVGFYVNMKVMIGRVNFYGVRDRSRQ